MPIRGRGRQGQRFRRQMRPSPPGVGPRPQTVGRAEPTHTECRTVPDRLSPQRLPHRISPSPFVSSVRGRIALRTNPPESTGLHWVLYTWLTPWKPSTPRPSRSPISGTLCTTRSMSIWSSKCSRTRLSVSSPHKATIITATSSSRPILYLLHPTFLLLRRRSLARACPCFLYVL